MAAMAIWDSPVAGCGSSPRWSRHARSVQNNYRTDRKFLELHSIGSLQCLRSRPRHINWWDGQRKIHWQGRRRDILQLVAVVTEKIMGGSQLSANADPPLRRLILLRHAKSSWTDRSIKVIYDIISAAPTSRSRISRIWSNMEKNWASDHERPLSKRGRQAAANIACKLQQQSGWEPQLILCSDSTRTRETLDIMQQQLGGFLEGEIRYFSSFYSVAAMDGQTLQHLQEIICQYSNDDITTIMCMGHNRGWEEAASLLSGISVELKTANAALLESRGSSWQEVFERAGLGGWKLVTVLRPDTRNMEGVVE